MPNCALERGRNIFILSGIKEKIKMKTTNKKISAVALLLSLLMMFSLCSCGNGSTSTATANDAQSTTAVKTEQASVFLWDDAIYTEDTTLGEGSKTITVDCAIADDKVTFTIKTDAENVGDALLENQLVEGDNGEYGLFITKVNGISAVYEKDNAYWAFYIDGQMADTGVSGAPVEDGKSYSLVYTAA